MKSKIEDSKMEAIIGIYKNRQDSLQCFKRARKTPAASGKKRNIVTEIGNDTFHCECITFVMYVLLNFTDGCGIMNTAINRNIWEDLI